MSCLLHTSNYCDIHNNLINSSKRTDYQTGIFCIHRAILSQCTWAHYVYIVATNMFCPTNRNLKSHIRHTMIQCVSIYKIKNNRINSCCSIQTNVLIAEKAVAIRPSFHWWYHVNANWQWLHIVTYNDTPLRPPPILYCPILKHMTYSNS